VPRQVAAHSSPLKPLTTLFVFLNVKGMKSWMSLEIHLEKQLSILIGADSESKCRRFRLLRIAGVASSRWTIIIAFHQCWEVRRWWDLTEGWRFFHFTNGRDVGVVRTICKWSSILPMMCSIVVIIVHIWLTTLLHFLCCNSNGGGGAAMLHSSTTQYAVVSLTTCTHHSHKCPTIN